MFRVPNKYRERESVYVGSDDSDGNNGFFVIPHFRIKGYVIYIQASDGEGWEHVSVSIAEKGKKQKRCPTWEEMSWIKNLFWTDDDCVIQFHPSKGEYVNMHEFVLHLWRPTNQQIPIPDKFMVGINLTNNLRQ